MNPEQLKEMKCEKCGKKCRRNSNRQKFCKNCRKNYHHDYNRNPDVQKRRNANWKKYRNPIKHNIRAKNYAKKYPEKVKAGASARHKIKIPKGTTCFFCSNLAEERHHEDYSKPLIILFVCKKCHRRIHRT